MPITSTPPLPRAPEVVRYAELDVFGGSISSNGHHRPRLVEELSLLLLTKDIVLLGPDDLAWC